MFVRNSEGKLFEVSNNLEKYMVVPEDRNKHEYIGFTTKDVIVAHYTNNGRMLRSVELFERCDTEQQAQKIKEYVFLMLHEKKEKMIERRALNKMLHKASEANKSTVEGLINDCLRELREKYFEIDIRDFKNAETI